MKDTIQYVCPECGSTGGNSKYSAPLCHKCDYKVVMVPSHNGLEIGMSLLEGDYFDDENFYITDEKGNKKRRSFSRQEGFAIGAQMMAEAQQKLFELHYLMPQIHGMSRSGHNYMLAHYYVARNSLRQMYRALLFNEREESGVDMDKILRDIDEKTFPTEGRKIVEIVRQWFGLWKSGE